MPWNVTRSGQFTEGEILKYPQLGLVSKSVVLDATMFPMPSDRNARNYVVGGTILKLSVTNGKQYVKYDGTGTIEGILAHGVEILASATSGAEPAPMYFFDAIFASLAIVDFTLYASALKSTLNHCKFE